MIRRSVILALALSVVLSNVYFSVKGAPKRGPSPEPPQPKGVLTTTKNKPISVNGVSAITGATILTGFTIETPDQVAGTISLGVLGDLDIEPNTKIRLDFDENGNMKVTIVRGCATARTKKNIIVEFETPQGAAGATDHKNRKNLMVCFPAGAMAATVSVPSATALGGTGLMSIAAASVAGVGLPLGLRGSNPSPSSP